MGDSNSVVIENMKLQAESSVWSSLFVGAVQAVLSAAPEESADPGEGVGWIAEHATAIANHAVAAWRAGRDQYQARLDELLEQAQVDKAVTDRQGARVQ